MTGKANAAILFEPSAFDAQTKKIMGRNVAGATFLDAFVRSAEVDRYVGVASASDGRGQFRERVAGLTAGDPMRSARPVDVLTPNSLEDLAAVGTLYVPDPQIGRFAERRRYLDQRAYSLCGITHTISSSGAMGLLCDLLTAPVQPWDAMIYTSKSVRDAAVRQQEHYADYLEQRVGGRPACPVRAPIIPLGVDTARFDRLGRDAAARAMLRQRIGAAENDVVLLFFGRLIYHAKAHPVPMYLGLERAVRGLAAGAGRVHLVHTGQFPNQAAEDGFRGGAARYCPEVATHFFDGTDLGLAEASWAAADVFVSLSDNIQESFGITPVEAMAAGLPCLVSDWDGYRDTVVHGETGFRIPTWLPPAGSGAALADAYGRGSIDYDHYIGFASQMTAVQVPAFADAAAALIADPALRRRMGEAGRRRAREHYDWTALIGAYQDLWSELAEVRRTAPEIAPPPARVRYSRLSDPFDVFAAHATDQNPHEVMLSVDPQAPELADLLALKCNSLAAGSLLDQQGMKALLNIAQDGPQRLREFLLKVDPAQRVRAARTVGWLAKFGVLSIDSQHRIET